MTASSYKRWSAHVHTGKLNAKHSGTFDLLNPCYDLKK